MRIAFIGSAQYDAAALATFLWKLREKHPTATIVTGDGKGAEQNVYEAAQMLGFHVERPELTKLLDPDLALDFQVGQVIIDADIIVLVASGKRPKLAKDIWNRINLHEKDNRGGTVKRNGQPVSHRTKPIQLVEIAAKQKKPQQAREELAA